ncbi:hypothetical protein E0Y62_16605 [Cytobacillus praedii]|uniref:Uncharacterized protein n=1 Tax=Cytobacillus praedii TaxID=1742358 RepID=A0A4R1AXK1_9BACI|nr:hypothetical protein E0Y62_16605 [Cytobacillus praedii]
MLVLSGAGNVDDAYKNEVQWMFSSHCAFLNLTFAMGKAKNENVHKTLMRRMVTYLKGRSRLII